MLLGSHCGCSVEATNFCVMKRHVPECSLASQEYLLDSAHFSSVRYIINSDLIKDDNDGNNNDKQKQGKNGTKKKKKKENHD